MEIVVINGCPRQRSGKDLFVQYAQDILGKGRVLNISTVDFVKEIATKCGWDGTKTPENRKFLSDLKDLLTEWNDVLFKKVEEGIRHFRAEAYCEYSYDDSELWVFIHCREPREIQKFVDKMNARTLLIRRAAVEQNHQSNHSDADVLNYQYDDVIRNDSTLEDYYEQVRQYVGDKQK